MDIGVPYAEPRPRTLAGLATELEAALSEALGLPVQVVDLERGSPDLVHRVLRGFGLSLSRSFVEAHGGTLARCARSRTRRGSS